MLQPKKNIITIAKYKYYRAASGRDQFIEKNWKGKKIDFNQSYIQCSKYKKPNDEELRKKLSPLEFKVTQKNGTEKPFDNKF